MTQPETAFASCEMPGFTSGKQEAPPQQSAPHKWSLQMAKGQKRSNREIRKPKKEKTAAVVDAPFAGSLVRNAGNSNVTRGKPKG
ncbi:hypothetical protein K7H91_15720 [Martelella mediterranea]|uniref:hypothetical protein n=1 Tax=Martelella mediterranea TaxID=293089 RepID=UPI001E32EC2E|nr:hypothetical protein [Martelella mediterranea]MCD1635219.1 hypothetical protein [Martelella mediterranea]